MRQRVQRYVISGLLPKHVLILQRQLRDQGGAMGSTADVCGWRIAAMRFHRPVVTQDRYRVEIVCHGPQAVGTSRHGAPVCITASMPSSWRRRSPPGRPRGSAGGARRGAICCQSGSLSSAVPGTRSTRIGPGVGGPDCAGSRRCARRARWPWRATAWCRRRHCDQCRWCARALPSGWATSSSRRRTSGTVTGIRSARLRGPLLGSQCPPQGGLAGRRCGSLPDTHGRAAPV